MSVYSRAVYGRFRSYWLSYDRALAAALLARGGGLVELGLEAPARTVGLHALDQ